MNKKRIIEVDVLRGIAAICMVIGHSILRYPVNISEIPICKNLEYIIFTFHMELFFVLAGYVYKCDDYSTYIKGKVTRILLPYFIFALPNAFLHVWGWGFVNRIGSLKKEIMAVFLYGGGYWFLYTIFIIYMLFPIMEKIFCDSLLIAALILSIILGDIISTKLFCIHFILYHLPFFGTGYFLRKYGKTVLNKINAVNLKNTMILFISSVLIYILCNVLYKEFQISIVRYVRAFAIILCLLLAYKMIKKRENIQVMEVISKCSEYSLQIYLFNGYFLVIYRIVVCNILGITNPIVIILVLSTLIVTTSLMVCRLVSRNKILSMLIGIKQKEKEVGNI